MKNFFIAVFAVLAAPLCADEIPLADAARAAQNWIAMGYAPGATRFPSVASAETVVVADGGAYHRVSFAGGGFAITAADDDDGPVIAFAPSGEFDPASGSPLADILSKRFAAVAAARASAASSPMAFSVSSVASAASDSLAKAKWARLLGDGADASALSSGVSESSLADVRVAPLVKSKWSQGNSCYNYYTPSNYVCGCVATAMAQVMRYHEWPTASMSKFTRTCYVDGASTSLTSKGGTYDWASMPLGPNYSSTALAKRQAIGKICYDAGVSSCMQYSSDGSGTYGGFVYESFLNCFGYANAMSYMPVNTSSIDVDVLARLIKTNCDAGFPVLLGIANTTKSYGHEIIGDGYAYSDDDLYVHLNMGWSGSCDLWYALPEIDAGGYTFDAVQSIVYNIFPETTGDVLSGRVVDADGNPVEGATVSVSNKTTTTSGGGFWPFGGWGRPPGGGGTTTTITWSLAATATTGANGIWSTILTGGKTYKAFAAHERAKSIAASSEVTLTASGNPSSVNWSTGKFGYSGMTAGNLQMGDLALELEALPAETQNTEVSVPYDWLDAYYPSASGGGASAYETLAAQTGANGISVWESYVAGLDPTNEESQLETVIRFVDGVPVVEWNVTNANAESLGYSYVVEGKTNVVGEAWSPTNSAHRFFRVRLEKR